MMDEWTKIASNPSYACPNDLIMKFILAIFLNAFQPVRPSYAGHDWNTYLLKEFKYFNPHYV